MSDFDEAETDGKKPSYRIDKNTRGIAEHVTPLGELVRNLRRERGLPLKDMAEHLGISPAYLSALEKGQRGKPTWAMIQGMLSYFHIIWDEADELVRVAQMSDPRVRVDTSTTSANATFFANRLAREIENLSEEEISEMTAILDKARERNRSENHGN
jgi:Predicted transcriptional regulators